MPTHPAHSEPTHDWPYPCWIAHRGAGALAPENTLAAFRIGASHGYRMFECDAKLSADGVVFLLHDDTLERTSDGQGIAGALPWTTLSQFDAGNWHSPAYAGEPLPTLANLAHYCQANGFWLNIEIKPTPGREALTGREVAHAAQRLWQGQPAAMAPLLTSFQPESLAAARLAAPELRRGLLVETLWDGWQAAAKALGCQALIAERSLWNATLRDKVQEMGLRALAYTVNDPLQAQRLIRLRLDGIITDRVDQFLPGR